MAELDVRSLILDTEDTANTEDTSVAKKSSPKPTVTLKVALNNYPDVAIERKGKTERSKKLLVLLLSQKQYYVKSAAGKIEMITNDDAGAKVLGSFFNPASMPDGGYVPEEDTGWLSGPFLPGSKNAKYFIENYLYNDIVIDLIRHHRLMIPYSDADRQQAFAWAQTWQTRANGQILMIDNQYQAKDAFAHGYNSYDKTAFDIVYRYASKYEGEDNARLAVSRLSRPVATFVENDWESLKSASIFRHLNASALESAMVLISEESEARCIMALLTFVGGLPRRHWPGTIGFRSIPWACPGDQ